MRRTITSLAAAATLATLPALAALSAVAHAQGAAPGANQGAPAADPANTLIMELKYGKVTIQLRPDLAPKHVERVKTLAKQGFYNGLKFHRVIDGFMAQSGDPTGTGAGGSKLGNVPAEFSGTERYRRGTIGAARTADPNSANSQFFICFTDFGCDSLNGKYTIWGRVTAGMQYVDAVKRGEPPLEADTIQRLYLAADGPTAAPAKK